MQSEFSVRTKLTIAQFFSDDKIKIMDKKFPPKADQPRAEKTKLDWEVI